MFLIPFVILILISLSFETQANQISGNNITSLKAVTESRKLLQYQENGLAKGPSVDILNMLLVEAKLSAEVDFYPWSRAYNIALTQPNTLIFSIARTAEREKKFHWLIKVSEFIRSFISKKNVEKKTITSFAQAKGKSIAVVRDSVSYQTLLREGLKDSLYVVSSFEEAIALFDSNRVELLYTDPNMVKNYYLSKDQQPENIIDFEITKENRRASYIAISKHAQPKLVTRLFKAAEHVKKEKKYLYFLKYKPLIDQYSN